MFFYTYECNRAHGEGRAKECRRVRVILCFTLRCVAACCSVLQRVAACCSVLQCEAVLIHMCDMTRSYVRHDSLMCVCHVMSCSEVCDMVRDLRVTNHVQFSIFNATFCL